MTVQLTYKCQFLDSTGAPLSGGKVYFYSPGTSTPKTTYSDNSSTANTNPVVLDARGEAQVWGSGLYDVVVRNASDVEIYSLDNIGFNNASSEITFTASGTGAVETTVQEKLRERVSVLDFGAAGDGSTDDTTAVQNAIDSGAAEIIFPEGDTYLCGKITISNDVKLIGPGTLKLAGSTDDNLLDNTGTDTNIELLGLKIDGNDSNQTTYSDTLDFGSVNRLVIRDCIIENVCGAGVNVSEVDEYVLIENCKFNSGKEHSGTLNNNTIFVVIQGNANTDKQMVTIKDNLFIGITPSVAGQGIGGIFIHNDTGGTNVQGPKCTISGNQLHECGQDADGNRVGAITLYRAHPYSMINNNRVIGGDEKGIDVQGSMAPIIYGNYIEDTTSTAIALASRDSLIECSHAIIQANTIRDVAGTGIDCQGLKPSILTTTATEIIIDSNIIDGCLQAILLADWLGSRTITNNIIANVTSTGTTDDAPIAIIGSRDTGDQSVVTGLVFANNQVENLESMIRITEMTQNVSITNNSVKDVTTGPAFYVYLMDGAINFSGNSFSACDGFVTFNTCEHVLCNNNLFNNSSATIRGVTFDTLSATSLSLCNDNIFKDCDNDIINYDTAAGTNMCSNNISDASKTIREVSSTVTKTDNINIT
jgi:hypothetical protein